MDTQDTTFRTHTQTHTHIVGGDGGDILPHLGHTHTHTHLVGGDGGDFLPHFVQPAARCRRGEALGRACRGRGYWVGHCFRGLW